MFHGKHNLTFDMSFQAFHHEAEAEDVEDSEVVEEVEAEAAAVIEADEEDLEAEVAVVIEADEEEVNSFNRNYVFIVSIGNTLFIGTSKFSSIRNAVTSCVPCVDIQKLDVVIVFVVIFNFHNILMHTRCTFVVLSSLLFIACQNKCCISTSFSFSLFLMLLNIVCHLKHHTTHVSTMYCLSGSLCSFC